MSAPNFLVLGLLLLTANLSFCVLFGPNRLGSEPGEKAAFAFKWIGLWAVNVGAWALVLFLAGAAGSFGDLYLRCAAAFVFLGGDGGGFEEPWSALTFYMGLNGLLFLPACLVPWVGGTRALRAGERQVDPAEMLEISKNIEAVFQTASRETGTREASPAEPLHGERPTRKEPPPLRKKAVPQQPPAPAAPPAPATQPAPPMDHPVDQTVDQTVEMVSVVREEPFAAEPDGSAFKSPVPAAPSPPPPQAAVFSSAVPADLSHAAPRVVEDRSYPADVIPTEVKPFGFRPTIPKVRRSEGEPKPEDELAELLKPVAPKPPPIRFQWGARAE